jgi:hypothetical protein
LSKKAIQSSNALLARRAYCKALRDIVTVQCCARKWLARRELRKLKVR